MPERYKDKYLQYTKRNRKLNYYSDCKPIYFRTKKNMWSYGLYDSMHGYDFILEELFKDLNFFMFELELSNDLNIGYFWIAFESSHDLGIGYILNSFRKLSGSNFRTELVLILL